MRSSSRLGRREERSARELREALTSSLRPREVMASAQQLLREVVNADHVALGQAQPDAPDRFDWIALTLPKPFFEGYAEFARHDFVRVAALKRPNRVLRDTDIIPRSALEASFMYHRARDLGTPLEQVMSVLFDVGEGCRAGISFYRTTRRPFSDAERDRLEELAPTLANTLRNCRLFAAAQERTHLLDALLERERTAVVVLSPLGRELHRTAGATRLIESWFERSEHGGALPPQLRELALCCTRPGAPAAPFVVRSRGAEALHARLALVPSARHYVVVVQLEVRPSAYTWSQALTRREHDIVLKVTLGWSNRLIAQELGCREATVKKHLQRVFDKLGVSSRARLMVLVREREQNSPER